MIGYIILGIIGGYGLLAILAILFAGTNGPDQKPWS